MKKIVHVNILFCLSSTSDNGVNLYGYVIGIRVRLLLTWSSAPLHLKVFLTMWDRRLNFGTFDLHSKAEIPGSKKAGWYVLRFTAGQKAVFVGNLEQCSGCEIGMKAFLEFYST